MLALENADEILQILDRFTKQKSKEIPPELEEYIDFVAKTGDTVYRWPTVQYLFREKLRNVIKEFHDTTASIEDLPQCPNVDQFNYESMKTLLFERFDHFQAAPFTIQRLCELLTAPKKHYSRLDKFMRALEKNILVVSTTEPGRKPSDIGENGDETMNGDILSAISVGIETTKTILKCDGELNTNGNLKIEKDNGTISDVPIDEVASSSGVTKSDNADAVTVAEPPKDQPTVESIEKDSAEEKSISDKPTIDDTPKMDVEPAVDVSSSGVPTSDNAEVTVTVAITVAEPSKDQPTVESSKKDSADEKSISDKPTVDDKPKVDVEPAVVDKSQVEKEDIPVAKEESSEAIMKEIPPAENIVEPSTDAKVEPLSPVKEPVIIDKPPTPKRACSDDEDDPIQNGCAKKIKLEEPQPEVSKVDSKEKSEASADDKAKKEDVVDSALPAEQEKVVDSSTDNSPAECVIEKEPIEKALEPVVEDEPQASIDSITPVSTNDLAPTEPIAEEKLPESTDNNINITEPIVTTPATPVDMNIEENETVAPAAAIPDTAMEAAPIKADEEMDVDESNSADADAMDL